jgi:hypothetical protein
MLALAAQTAVATPVDLGEARHAFDVQIQQVARMRMFIAHDRRRRVEVAPPAQLLAAQDAADGGGAQPSLARDPEGRLTLVAQLNDPLLWSVWIARRGLRCGADANCGH